MDEHFIRSQLALHELSWRSLWLIPGSEPGRLETERLNLHIWLVLIVQRRRRRGKEQTAALRWYCIAPAQHTCTMYSAKDGWEYSSGEWVQIAVEPEGIWQHAPRLPANWVLMNHWFGMLHVPADGWCHWCIEDARSSGRDGWTWEADPTLLPASHWTLHSLTRCYRPWRRGLLAKRLHTMEIIVWWAGNSLPHLIPVTLFVMVGSLPHCQLNRVSATWEITEEKHSESMVPDGRIAVHWRMSVTDEITCESIKTFLGLLQIAPISLTHRFSHSL